MTETVSNRWARWAPGVAMFLAGLILAFIVILAVRDQVSFGPSVYKQQRTRVMVNGHALPVEFLEQVDGEASLTQDQFALRVGERLAQHARETKTESCASICRAENGAWGAAPLTVGGHVICPVTPHCPTGMTATQVSIHSHPLEKGDHFVVNEADAALGGRKGRLMKAGDPELFSREDIQGMGYVVTYRGTLLFQEGRGRIRRIGAVSVGQ